jgi:hypothetical protein
MLGSTTQSWKPGRKNLREVKAKKPPSARKPNPQVVVMPFKLQNTLNKIRVLNDGKLLRLYLAEVQREDRRPFVVYCNNDGDTRESRDRIKRAVYGKLDVILPVGMRPNFVVMFENPISDHDEIFVEEYFDEFRFIRK